MELLATVALAAVAAAALFFIVFGWVSLTSVAPRALKRCLVRYCVRGICKRADNSLPWDEAAVSCVVDDAIYMGRMPKQPEHLVALRKDHRVSALVTMNETWELPFYLAIAGIMDKPVAKPHGVLHGTDPEEDQLSTVSFLHLPTVDFHAPSQADIKKGVAWMQDHTAAGHSVYVHCNAGRGRSAVVVLCYLMATMNCSAAEAYALVQTKRNIADLTALCGTRPQWRAIKAYEKHLAKTREPRSAALNASKEGAAGVGLPAKRKGSSKVAPEP